MGENNSVDITIVQAIRKIQQFIKETTGTEATEEEIASALIKYFVMNEIKDHVKMARGEEK